MLARSNALALIGPDGAIEIALFRQAQLVGEGRYRLSQFLRGIGLSEQVAARTLAPGAEVIVLDDAIVDLGLTSEHMGQSIEIAAIPAGRDLADAATTRVTGTIAGRAYRPLAPVHAKARREAGGVRLSFIRRTRFGGDNWDLYEVPLGEEREEYRIEIRDGATVKRSMTVSSPEFLYPAAQEIADFGGAQASLAVSIAQISARWARGRSLCDFAGSLITNGVIHGITSNLAAQFRAGAFACPEA